MSQIKLLILDVMKPHEPSIIVLSQRISAIEGVYGVNCMLDEVDQETMSIKVTIEGSDIDYQKVQEAIESCGAVIHSIDGVSAGRRRVEEVETPQDR
ncbi:MAG: DUF211 domain-containing protein [Candidatus Thermoplasmatota archaeon]|nr:DUF211 domain-containing protein [Candidatus Thermoplasmatota archaeon]